ncbi:DegV family protein [Ectobacillus ponti]|uniref:DegV family protein n=1 Tax=Ectobacillus ponti TaxID=2961894 RepID=A0AA42BQY4_9BACI|nr:DegV family protein [Ectobacillus ponti]MCP8970750.1 DegV family protein [Ectobacillus ponti]
MTVAIITDSAADLAKDMTHTYGIEVIPLRVYEEETEYTDGGTLQPEQLLQRMREGAVYKTSLPAYEATYAAFASCAEKGAPCVYLAFSSELSGTYQSSLLVKEDVLEQYPDFELHIVDTKCASLGQGLVVLEAAKLAANGASAGEIAERAAVTARQMEHIFTVADLQYLVRGGRISKVAGFVGGLLNIKPVLHVEDGKLVPLEKLRGRKKVLQRILELVEERGTNIAAQTIGISHGDDLESAEELRHMLAERFGCQTFVIHTIGAAVGAHAGPGTLALFFLNERK